jgi:zinc resistance-associated protein
MMKAILIGTTALAIAGSTLVFAQQRPGRDGLGPRFQQTAEDVRAFGEARLAALKAGLALTVEQEKNWAPFAQAARDLIKLRSDRLAALLARRNAPAAQPADPIARLQERANAMAANGTALQKLAEAADPLYKSLDDGQKRRFAMLSRLGGPRGGRLIGRGDDRFDRGFDGRGGNRFGRRFGFREDERFDRGFGGREGERFGRGPGRFEDFRFDRFRGREGERFGRGPDYRFDGGPRERGLDRSERGAPRGFGFERDRRFEGYGMERGFRGREGQGIERGPRRFEDFRFDGGRRPRTSGGPDADGEDL